MPPSTDPQPLAILITGCSAGGIGAALAHAFAARSTHSLPTHVFATLRTPAKADATLSALSNVTILPLDVTSAASIAACVAAVDQHTNGRGLNVLLNNAGAGYTMPLLDVDVELARRVFEVNVWGVMGATKAFSDCLVKNGGLVVNISSVGGVVYTPWIGIYSSSKAALTILSETLRLELAPLGVSVLTVMVGTITTAFHANEPTFHLPPESRYQPIQDTIGKWASGEAGPKGIGADELAKVLVGDVLGKAGGKAGANGGQIWRGPMAGAVKFVSSYVPGFLLDGMLSNGQGLDDLAKWVRGQKEGNA